MEAIHTRKINWQMISALAALDAGIVISWTAYHNFQPKLLLHFHFEHLGGFVRMAQSIVMLSVPLLAGLATDYYRRKNGNGFSVFAVGIAVASMIFMAVAFTISDQTFINIIWLLPVMILFWLISMNIFHSPANAILEGFSRSSALPLMMAMLVMAKAIINAGEPVLLFLLEEAGGTLTFVTGGVILIVSGVWFARATKNMSLSHHEAEGDDKDRFPIVLLSGLLAGLCNALVLHFFPAILQAKFGSQDTIFRDHLYVSLMLGVTAVSAIPLSRFVKTNKVYPVLLISLLISFIVMLIILTSGSYIVCLVASLLLALSYGLVLITAFPHALQNITVKNATFGTGLFFVGFEFFEVFFSLTSAH